MILALTSGITPFVMSRPHRLLSLLEQRQMWSKHEVDKFPLLLLRWIKESHVFFNLASNDFEIHIVFYVRNYFLCDLLNTVLSISSSGRRRCRCFKLQCFLGRCPFSCFLNNNVSKNVSVFIFCQLRTRFLTWRAN